MILKMCFLALTVGFAGIPAWALASQQVTAVPKTWDEQALADSRGSRADAPLLSPRGTRIPVRPIYKGDPVYAVGKEPRGYFETLQRRQPEVVWNDHGIKPRLETEPDWVKAG